ncbi:SnoaL-like domain family protein [Aspergillus niger]|uniref:SnoaL-like domain family protein n=1 Tax=Aspergillus niger TaxID=5061 RepID=A0A505IG38_ASPNG|nr:SnoaL-like domain family protein [Aspergillus niger]
MTDLTPTFSELLRSKSPSSKLSTGYMTTEIADEFLKEAYRINNHITSLLSYLHTIRPSYLSLTTKPTTKQQHQHQQPEILDDTARDTITTTTSTLLSNLSTSITTLSAAENLRQETVSRSITQRFGKGLLAKWAGGATLTSGNNDEGKEEEQIVEEEKEKVLKGQLQLFEEENDSMVKYFEDVVGKVQNAEKSLLEISSLQQTLVSHLSTQEEYISQLVTDASNTEANIGQGNKELKRATERRSTAQVVFWGTVGLCTWLVVWDLVL